MKILILGTHPHAHMPSMELYAEWLKQACEVEFDTHLYKPAPIFFNRFTKSLKIGKWLKYTDIYIIATVWLWLVQGRYDLIVSADHGNAPTLSLVRPDRTVAMVHDVIAIQASLFPEKDIYNTGGTGRALQKWIVWSLKRCRLLFANPGPLSQDLRALGISTPIVVLGCPFEPRRMSAVASPEALSELPSHFYLNVGSDDRRKRKKDLLRLWQAFEKGDSKTWLVLAGKTNPDTCRQIEELGLKRVKILSFVSNSLLAELYRLCKGLLVASLFEGFCIPVLEALAFEKPVFTPADRTFFQDIFGDAVQPLISFDQAGADALQSAGGWRPDANYEAARRQLLEIYGMPNFCHLVVRSLKSLDDAKTR